MVDGVDEPRRRVPEDELRIVRDGGPEQRREQCVAGAVRRRVQKLGAERAIPNYNVMGLAKASLEANVRYMANAMGPEGVRVNGISAGPIRTLAASGIKDFRKMLAHCEAVTPIRRTVTIEDVGNSAAFLCSDLSAGISGEVVHVDGGFNIAAMNELEIK